MLHPTRRLALGAMTLLFAGAAWAQAYPNKTIEWVVPYPAGGGTDVAARTLAEAMGKTLGQTIVINNRPGAGTNIGAEYTARAKADGYVMMTADTATLAANPALYTKLGYNAERDLAPVGLIGRFNLLLVVNPAVPATTLKEFLAWAKAQPQPVPFATPGAGSPHHLAVELLRLRTVLQLTHVPYRGAAPAIQDVVGGQVPFMVVDSAAGYAQISAGRLRALAVASPRRLASLSQVPTFAEQGLANFEAYAWQGLALPAGTPAPLVKQLSKALNEALDSTVIKARFQVLGIEPTPGTPEAMAAYASAERARWGEIIKQAGIKLD
jgi:tripartite-type tricarboxylate transporter receptor subunit TctC